MVIVFVTGGGGVQQVSDSTVMMIVGMAMVVGGEDGRASAALIQSVYSRCGRSEQAVPAPEERE